MSYPISHGLSITQYMCPVALFDLDYWTETDFVDIALPGWSVPSEAKAANNGRKIPNTKETSESVGVQTAQAKCTVAMSLLYPLL